MSERFDVAIIGAGMAGASLAAELASHTRVLLLEAEDHPGYHSTGRSAAFWSESYGGPMVQPLTSASGPFLKAPPRSFSERGFLTPRGALHIADAAGAAALDALRAEFAGSGLRMERLGRAALEKKVAGLRPGWDVGMWEPTCSDIDVAALHAAYLSSTKRAGGQLRVAAKLVSAERDIAGWRIATAAGAARADVLVNAAGAWADEVAQLAGARPLGIRPYRRTIAQLAIAPPPAVDMPLVIDAAGSFYFKPEAGGRLWLSPHDETPCAACDCAAEEIDVALAIDRMQSAVDWRVERIEHRWAGLRSFAPDRLPVYGFDARAPGFFWFVGQGGFGIQTAPAAAKLAAALLLGHSPDPMVAAIDPAPYQASRFMN